MGYSNDSEIHQQKTLRVFILSAMCVLLGFIWLGSKTSDCNPSLAGRCHDTFNIVNADQQNYACPPGSKAEIVSSPPAPKPGIICRCINTEGAPLPAGSAH